ncbi:MAG TPA: ATP-binding protein [Polyangiales bacterium]|nr:ATP-binding protein [Polyangiales bacterium]
MKLLRFERKILGALVVAAVVPLLGTLALGRVALREVYQIGVNARIGDELERGLSLYRDYISLLRQAAGDSASAIGEDWAVREALLNRDPQHLGTRLQSLLQQYPGVAGMRVQDASGGTLAEVRDQKREVGQRLLPIQRLIALPTGSVELSVIVTAPERPFTEFQRAGELSADYRRLQRGTGQLSTLYLVVYTAFMLSVIIVALAAGVILSRRVTRRVSLLAAATRRLGAGDLRVHVPIDVNDEIGELTREFNTMVRDLRESRTRIEYLQRIGAWQEFARRLAHEIKNPLTPIQLAIQELDRSYRGDDAAFAKRLHDARAIIQEEVAALRRLTTEFSAFAKLPEASLALADLNDYLREVSRSLDGAVVVHEDRGPSAELSLELCSDPLPVRIDAMMLKRCLDNLVRNAAQALDPQPDLKRVVIRSERAGQYAVLEVHDNGPGIAESARQRVFDPYFTTKTEGTGLGLPIVKKVVLEHGGEIQCAESPLGGALFRIELPLAL